MDPVIVQQASQYLVYGVPATALVAYLKADVVEAGVPEKYADLVAVGLGLAVGVGISFESGTSLIAGLFVGLFIGVAAGKTGDAIAALKGFAKKKTGR